MADDRADPFHKLTDPETAGLSDQSTLEMGRTFAPGRKISGRYAVQQIIGRGAFGEVYKIYDELLGRLVALKTLSLGKPPEDINPFDYFLQEARTIARLDHPNIVPVYDAGVEDAIPWMVVRLIEGRSLAQLLRQEGRMTAKRAAGLLAQATRALEHSHQKGIIHRDVKPSNILIEARTDGAEHVWLADFGIARLLTGDNTTTREGAIAGTPSYMSPEQVTGKRVDTRTDIFALGCVAFEMVIGTRCFREESWSQLVYSIVHQQPEQIGDIRRLAGLNYEVLVKRALAKSPEDRFQTAAEMTSELESIFLGTQPVQAGFRSVLLSWRRAYEPAPWNGENVVVIEGVTKAYRPGRPVLGGVSLRVPARSIYALLGRNGSGKTTLIRTLLGMYKADSGRVLVFGRDPTRNRKAVLSRMGYVPETPAFYQRLKLSELLQFVSSFYPQWDHAYCYKLLGRFDLPLNGRLRDLSKGMQTQVSLLIALAQRPEFLLLDDPTLGLDAIVLQEFFETVRDACQKEGTSIFLASHNLDEVEQVVSHIAFLKDGKILLSGPLDELRTRTRQVRMKFRDDAPDLHHLDQFRTTSVSGRHLTGVIFDTSSGVLDQLKAYGPEELEIRQLSLKEIFVSLLT